MEYMQLSSMSIERVSELIDGNVGLPYHSSSKLVPFEQQAKEELKDLNDEEQTEDIINIFSEYGMMGHTSNPEKILKLNLSYQDYITSPGKMKLKTCTHTGVMFKKQLLWSTFKFEKLDEPMFLKKAWLTARLQICFGNIELNLGELAWGAMKFIVWQFKTQNGEEYVIPWHNACLLKKTDEMTFLVKDFKELKSTYKILRFREVSAKEIYSILLA